MDSLHGGRELREMLVHECHGSEFSPLACDYFLKSRPPEDLERRVEHLKAVRAGTSCTTLSVPETMDSASEQAAEPLSIEVQPRKAEGEAQRAEGVIESEGSEPVRAGQEQREEKEGEDEVRVEYEGAGEEAEGEGAEADHDRDADAADEDEVGKAFGDPIRWRCAWGW